MGLAPELPFRVVQAFGAERGCRGRALGGVTPLIDEAPDSREKAPAPLQPGVRPLHFLLRRSDKHHVQPKRVGAVLLEHVVWIDNIAFGFRHDRAVLQHHALRQQMLEGLVVIDHS